MVKKGDAVYPTGYEPKIKDEKSIENRQSLLNVILGDHSQEISEDIDTDLFEVMKRRRSTRKFDSKPVEDWKVDKILAAADTAPTAGNFQGFEVFYIKNEKLKEEMAKAANNQPYVNSPIVIVYCKNPSRVKLQFPDKMLKKFAIQDATLAAAYSQLAATALSLSTIWIGMLDEKKVQDIIGTDLVPSSILCIGYPVKRKHPKPRRNLSELIHVLE